MREKPSTPGALAAFLEDLYTRYNRPEHIAPDPLEVALRYPRREDMEVAGLVSALLAYGGVRQIVASAADAIGRLGPRPADFLRDAGERELRAVMKGFRHRWTTASNVAELLLGVRRVIAEQGSLEEGFLAGLREEDETLLPALAGWVALLRQGQRRGEGRDLLSCPGKGSACKRLNLFLRWMVRSDGVDPGPWRRVPTAKLVIPLDLHMFRVGTWLGFTRRRAADLKTVLEITSGFRRVRPDDPVRYDFALTRAAMRGELDLPRGRLRRSRNRS